MLSYLPAAFPARSIASDCARDPGQGLLRAAAYPVSPEIRLIAEPTRLAQIEMLGRRCGDGDLRAWEPLFVTAWPVLVTFVHRLYRSFDEQDAEDIAQVSFEAATRGIATFTGVGSFRGWLFGIATRQAASFHRTRLTLKRGAGLLVSLEEVVEPRDGAKSPAEVSAASDRAGILHRALGELCDEDRDLVHLHFFGELTFKEIAAIRKMNPKTVCTRLTRCKERLLVILGRFNLTNADG